MPGLHSAIHSFIIGINRIAPFGALPAIHDGSRYFGSHSVRVCWVRSSIVFATLAVVIVFLPVLGLSGVAGRLFAPLGVAYIAAIGSSLVVALTITPALAWLLLGQVPLHPADPPLVARSKRGYGRLLSAVGRHPGLTLGGVAGLVIVAFASVPFMRTEFLPAFLPFPSHNSA